MPSSPRVRYLLGTVEIAGYLRRLQQGLQENGVEADLVTYSVNKFGYDADLQLPLLVRTGKRINRISEKSLGRLKSLPGWARGVGRLPGGVFLGTWALMGLFRYQVFIFAFGTSLLPWNLDLPILRMLGKTTVSIIGMGSESRPPYLNGALKNQVNGELPSTIFLLKKTQKIKRMIRRHERWATHIVGHPSSSSLLAARKQINLLRIGLPHPIGEKPKTNAKSNEVGFDADTIKIIHAPSRNISKGTEEIISAVYSLKSRGIPVDLEIIAGLPNAKVLSALSSADLVIDQLFSDTPMATLAVEASWLGVPVLVAGYELECLKIGICSELLPPTIQCSPENFTQVLEELCESKNQLRQIGNNAMDFVDHFWSPSLVAARFIKLANGDLVTEWDFEPGDYLNCYGYGLAPHESRANIERLIRQFGTKSLLIDDPLRLQNFIRAHGITA